MSEQAMDDQIEADDRAITDPPEEWRFEADECICDHGPEWHDDFGCYGDDCECEAKWPLL